MAQENIKPAGSMILCLHSHEGTSLLSLDLLADRSRNLLDRNGSWTTVLQQYGRTHRNLHHSQIAKTQAPISLQQADEIKWQDVESEQSSSETIVALSSGTGRSAVAVIRMSGPHSGSVCTVTTPFSLSQLYDIYITSSMTLPS